MYRIVLRDLFQSGTDTIIVGADVMQMINSTPYFDWTIFDTVSFNHAYPASIVKM